MSPPFPQNPASTAAQQANLAQQNVQRSVAFQQEQARRRRRRSRRRGAAPQESSAGGQRGLAVRGLLTFVVLAWAASIATHVEWVRLHDGPVHPIRYVYPALGTALVAVLLVIGSVRRRALTLVAAPLVDPVRTQVPEPPAGAGPSTPGGGVGVTAPPPSDWSGTEEEGWSDGAANRALAPAAGSAHAASPNDAPIRAGEARHPSPKGPWSGIVSSVNRTTENYTQPITIGSGPGSSQRQVLSLRVETFDERGNRTNVLTVELRAPRLAGDVAIGDRVEVVGRVYGGVIRARRINNRTTGATVRDVGTKSRFLLRMLAIVIVIAVVGLFAVMIIHASANQP